MNTHGEKVWIPGEGVEAVEAAAQVVDGVLGRVVCNGEDEDADKGAGVVTADLRDTTGVGGAGARRSEVCR